MRRLLITGSCGFIGQYAIAESLKRGWHVAGLDVRTPIERGRLDTRLLRGMEADVILHLAAFSSNAGFADDLAENWANNVTGLWNVLQLAQRRGARVVYASSSAVYGNDIWGPDVFNTEQGIPEDETASHYGRSKLINEMTAASFADLGLKCLGLRIFNAYGSGDEAKPRGRQAPPTWMQGAKREGRPAVIFGDGRQAKDFIHVSDVVEIIMRLLDSDATGVVNVGTGVATSFNDLARMIDVPVEYAPIPDEASYQFFTRADTSRLLSLIGDYKFKTVEEGLKICA